MVLTRPNLKSISLSLLNVTIFLGVSLVVTEWVHAAPPSNGATPPKQALPIQPVWEPLKPRQPQRSSPKSLFPVDEGNSSPIETTIEDDTEFSSDPKSAGDENPLERRVKRPLSRFPANDSKASTVRLDAQREEMAKVMMFRQLAPRQFETYQSKSQQMMRHLFDLYSYLQSLETVPSVQRISGFNGAIQLEWKAFRNMVAQQPNAQKFESYNHIKAVVDELDAVTRYWVARNRVKRVYGGSAEEDLVEQDIHKSRLKSIATHIEVLQQLDALQDDLIRDIPY